MAFTKQQKSYFLAAIEFIDYAEKAFSKPFSQIDKYSLHRHLRSGACRSSFSRVISHYGDSLEAGGHEKAWARYLINNMDKERYNKLHGFASKLHAKGYKKR